MNSSANTAPVAAEPDKISAWDARTALCVRIRTGSATKMEATQIPCTLVKVKESSKPGGAQLLAYKGAPQA